MRIVYRPRQRLQQRRGLLGREGFARELRCEVTAVHKLQHQAGLAVVLADLVDLHDVGVLQAGRRLGLTPEAGQLLGVGLVAGSQQLQGHDPIQGHLPGLVDHTHSAAAQLRQEFITPGSRLRTRRERVSCLWGSRQGPPAADRAALGLH